MAEKKTKRYVSDNAQLLAEWDWDKNNSVGLDPSDLVIGSHKHAFWICSKHKTKFEQEIRARAKGERTCPQCHNEWRTSISRDRYIKGKKTLAETHPELVAEWIECDNPKFTPNSCVAGSNVKVRWKCAKCGGEYEAYIASRALRGSSCPYCANQKVLVGYNDLQTVSPDLAAEWSKKNTIKPTEVTQHSNKEVYWICPLGHDDYLMSVKQRSNRQGCRICAQQSQTSFPEQAILYYLKKVFSDAINRYIFDGKEIDIFIPSKNIGIEYNGYFSHKKKAEKDILKKEFFKSLGINLLVVKEYKYPEDKKQADFYIHERTSFNDLTCLITDILNALGIDESIIVDCSKDAISIKNQYVILRKENSIAAVRPDLVSRWDYEKNGSITPEMVTLGTGQKFYWKCKICNRSYLALPSKIAEGSVCSKHRNLLKKGENDLASRHPELLKYWDYEKNEVDPSEIYGGGEKEVYWICEKGHSYSKKILKRIRGEGCPICAGKKVLAGFNDLVTVCPDVASTWNYAKNREVLPTQVTAHSNKQFWWICEQGHEWEASVNARVNGKGCKECYKEQKGKRQINLYDADTLALIATFDSVKSVCEYLEVDYKKMNGTISRVCRKEQKTLMRKYIVRNADNDELSGL